MPFVNAVMDAPLDVIATATIMVVCSDEPTTYAELTSTFALADVVVDSGDFTKANHTTGRKVTVGAQTGVDVDTSGTAAWVGFGISGSSTFLGAVECGSAALDDAGQVNIPAFEIRNPQPA